VKAYRIVRKELKNYGAGLLEKPEVIGLNKIDAIDPAEAKKLATKLKRASKAEVLMMSGASGQGIPDVLDRLSDAVGTQSSVRAEAAVEWSPI
jgi:GTPase